MNRYALIIGCDFFNDKKLNNLKGPHNDVRSIETLLSDESVGAYKVERIYNAKAGKLRVKLEEFFIQRKFGDSILIYYSGHGIKNNRGDLFFAATDTNYGLLQSTSIPSGFIAELMRQTKAKSQLIILDCCYSGTFVRQNLSGKSINSTDVLSKFQNQKGVVVFSSSDVMELSFEENRPGRNLNELMSNHSYFTKAIINGISTGKADLDNDGIIHTAELHEYVSNYIREMKIEQTPLISEYNLSGKFPVAINKFHPLNLTLKETKDLLRKRQAIWDIELYEEIKESLYSKEVIAFLKNRKEDLSKLSNKKIISKKTIAIIGKWLDLIMFICVFIFSLFVIYFVITNSIAKSILFALIISMTVMIIKRKID